jgi:hypothetical protein
MAHDRAAAAPGQFDTGYNTMKLVFVRARDGDPGVGEIFDSIAFEARAAGVETTIVDEVFPTDADAVYVVAAREYFSRTPSSVWPDSGQLTRTFALNVDRLGSESFEDSATQSQRCAEILDIYALSTAEFQRRSQPATHFPFGYSQNLDRWNGEDGRRPTDIVVFGSTDPKTERALAASAPLWWDRTVQISLDEIGARPPSGTIQSANLEQLTETELQVALDDGATEVDWPNVVRSISNGCVLVLDSSVDASPLVPGVHFAAATTDSLGIIAVALLDDHARRHELRTAAWQFLRSSRRLSDSVTTLIERAQTLLANPLPVPAADSVPVPEPAPARQPAWLEFETSRDQVTDAVARIEIKTVQLTRALAIVRAELADLREPHHSEPEQTPAFASVAPEVSVCMPAYNVARYIVDALDSVAASRDVTFEILVHDDASTDNTAAVVLDYMAAHPDVPIRLSRAKANTGLAATRNVLLADARAEFTFFLDSDNGVYPTALSRLLSAIRASAGAVLAYSIIATFNSGRPQNLLSARPWSPPLFRYGNYIDAMALLNTARARELGGWDPELPNWEDFHFWVRVAERGWDAVFVPEMLSWYRVMPYSMSQESAIHRPRIWAMVRAAAPNVLG